MSEDLADQLDDVAGIIERHGWYQGAYGPPGVVDGQELVDGPMCLSGALVIATGGALLWSKVGAWYVPTNAGFTQTVTLYHHVEDQLGTVISIWNDAPSRTKQEVLDTVRAMAKEARS